MRTGFGMKTLVTGATGFIGRVIVRKLEEKGHEVVVLTRNIPKAALILGPRCRYVQWTDIKTPPPSDAFEGVEGIINLMGESIGEKKWTEEQKKKIVESRVEGTSKLIEALGKMSVKPKVFVSASAIGIYGNRGPEDLDENSEPGTGFLSDLCQQWEDAANKAQKIGMRVAIIRVGVVLGKGGGALSKMVPLFKLGLGGRLGEGNQYMSWIHIQDLASMFVMALTDSSMSGPFNGTAPYPATNQDFTKVLGKVLRRPTFLPAPEKAIRTLLGEMATIVLEGQKVLPKKFKEKKFNYRYPTLEMTLKETAP
jgi:uncharacterized protein (TIGR01777 family)